MPYSMKVQPKAFLTNICQPLLEDFSEGGSSLSLLAADFTAELLLLKKTLISYVLPII